MLLVELSSADDVAKLNSLKAPDRARAITYERDQRQLQAQAVSKQVVDTDEQNYRSFQAQVAQQQATLDYKTIRAPFDGRLGIRQVDVGQYLAPGTAVVTLQSLDPIFVDFTLPQQDIAQIRVGQKVDVACRYFPEQGFRRHDRARSIRRSTPRPATCKSARRSPMPIIVCCRACSRG